MGIRWRDFEIKFTDPGCVILQDPKTYGIPVVYRRQFKTLFDGLSYIIEKAGFTESSEIQEALQTMTRIKNDLKIACSRLEAEPDPDLLIKTITPKTTEKSKIKKIKKTPTI